MASKPGQRVRLVKCPKCLKILQEDEDVPVYQCGGCSAILQAKRRSVAPNTTPNAGETKRAPQASEPETNNVSSSSGPDTVLPSPTSRSSPNTTPNAGETEGAPQASEQRSKPETNNVSSSSGPDTVLPSHTGRSSPNTTPNAGETEGAPQASEQRSKPETNNVSSSSGPDTVLPSHTGRSSGQEDEKARGGSIESTEKQPGGLELSNGEEMNEIHQQEHSLGDSDMNEGEDNSSRLKFDVNSVAEAMGPGTSLGTLNADHVVDAIASTGPGTSSGSLNADYVVDARASAGPGTSSGSLNADHMVDARASTGPGTSSGSLIADHVVDARPRAGPGSSSGSLNADHVVDARASNSSSDAYHQLEAEISSDASQVEEEQDEEDYVFQPHRESTDDLPANKTSSAYDGSESSSGEREDQLLDENEQWNALQKIRSGKFEMQRYPENFKEQGGSSSSTFSEKRPNGTTTYQNRSLQLEGPGGRLGRHVTEQLRPDLPFYPREPYTRVSPSYPSHDEFDRYSRAHSLQMPPYAGGMNYESVDHMYHNNTRERGQGQGSRFSGEMTNERRNHPGWYSSQLYSSYSSYSASPQRPMEQPQYYPRWSHEIVSDAEDHQRNRHVGHYHELQTRRLKERQRVAKSHIRPTAGGAPFVSCYSCSENLQLPVDFLIFKRKYHLLRCGTCTTVLRFSLQSRTHLIPAVTHDINANRSSTSTSESLRDKAPSNPEKPSSSAQEEEVHVARSSPLHRLMGYTTVSQVFKAPQRPPSV